MNTTNNHDYCPRLIEVALPIQEISAESVREKSIRHGHLSTLHLWWARRPLAVSRAIVFASIVPDPDSPKCPEEFKNAVRKYLKDEVPFILREYRKKRDWIKDNDPYSPYKNIEDTLRNRLLMFIAKWSPESIRFKNGQGTKPPSKQLLDDRSLVKWETSDPDNPQGIEVLKIAKELVTIAHGGEIPTILDPFAGGGAIPLEAGRLGANPIANEYNPVAYLLLRGTCEFPQKYGKPGKRTKVIRENNKETKSEINVDNVLAFDVEHWANRLLDKAREIIGDLYPTGKDGKSVIGYIWARTAPCSNPSCRGVIPLLRSLYLCNKKNKKVALTMDVDKQEKTVDFDIATGKDIKTTEGTMLKRGNVKCPFCEQVTPVSALREAGCAGKMSDRMVAVITDGENGKDYRAVCEIDLNAYNISKNIEVDSPAEKLVHNNSRDFKTPLYGLNTWGSLFNERQLVAMQTFVECIHEIIEEMREKIDDQEYIKAISVYLGLWIDRIAVRMTNVGRWNLGRETLEAPFDKQAIPMKWDYPEVNPFNHVTGGAQGQLDWMLRFIKREGENGKPSNVILGDGATISLYNNSIDHTITDPPYFDAISYSDLSDFFYIWLKRGLKQLFSEVFLTPLSPKGEEATALDHRHNGDSNKADEHFVKKMSAIFKEMHRLIKKDGVITVMFAHQSTKAWTALINALFDAELTINSTWPIDTELQNRSVALGSSALTSSITVACRERIAGIAAAFNDVKNEITDVVSDSVKRFWSYGFRGADLIVSCYGPAVGVFGKYERVEKADGTPVEIPELLKLAREIARDEIAGEFRGDNLSTLYYVWANLYGANEQDWDDARLVVQIGGDAENAMDIAKRHGIFVIEGSKCRLSLMSDREETKDLGMESEPTRIDALHKTMILWKEENRKELMNYLLERNLLEDNSMWKLAQSLFEVLPRNIEDWKYIHALLGERHTLMAEAKGKGFTTDLFED